MKTNNKRRPKAPRRSKEHVGITLTRAITMLLGFADAQASVFRDMVRLGQALNRGSITITRLRKEYEAHGRDWDAVKSDISRARTVARHQHLAKVRRATNLKAAYAACPKTRKRRVKKSDAVLRMTIGRLIKTFGKSKVKKAVAGV